MFLCTYIVLKASSCMTFSVIFAYRASIACIDSGTCDMIRVSFALVIRFFNISINRYTPTPPPSGVTLCFQFTKFRGHTGQKVPYCFPRSSFNGILLVPVFGWVAVMWGYWNSDILIGILLSMSLTACHDDSRFDFSSSSSIFQVMLALPRICARPTPVNPFGCQIRYVWHTYARENVMWI